MSIRVKSYTLNELQNKNEGIQKLAKAINEDLLSTEQVIDIEKEWSEDKNLADYRNRLSLHAIVMIQS